MLKGKAKTNYQREYMRELRRKKQVVRPPELDLSKPIPSSDDEVIETMLHSITGVDADGHPIYEE